MRNLRAAALTEPCSARAMITGSRLRFTFTAYHYAIAAYILLLLFTIAMKLGRDKLRPWRVDAATRSRTAFSSTRLGLAGSEPSRNRLVFCPTRGTVVLRTGRSDDKETINSYCFETMDVFALD